ncbi:type IV toxin-antitoxin system AbiEi family antitoxin domain-containing protein [Lactiplantibacillus pentosus]|uniref:type IV toxin-antitoxin system AbiEi family antitoxin domain-containing protein n=1 Tax=Lactiplantibacillus pentosus TaxID=1589 RepID=UPI00234B1A48|nr:type IV toxin-antitoxin system AbiEi family antitoxin domain-containing protein [Lactiplantibacillus pentosus]MDC6398118.1 abortive phage infection protein [Lactiplantibacillus pentosus]
MDDLRRLEHDFPTFTFKTAREYGLSKEQIRKLSTDGSIEKVDRGIYVFPGYLLDEFSLISQKFSRGILSLVSALIIYELTDEMPLHYDVTFPQGYHPISSTITKYHLNARYLSKNRYLLGITTRKNENGGTVNIYSKERTLLDVWESKQLQPYIKNDALQRYLASSPAAAQIRALTELKNNLYPNSTLLKVMEIYQLLCLHDVWLLIYQNTIHI